MITPDSRQLNRDCEKKSTGIKLRHRNTSFKHLKITKDFFWFDWCYAANHNYTYIRAYLFKS